MNKRFDFTQLGGFPFTQDRLDFMQQSYRGAFGAMAGLIGNLTILMGCVIDVATNTVSDGWISYQGELIFFVGGGYSNGVVILDTAADLNFQDGNPHTVQFTKTATCGLPAEFLFTDLKRIQSIRDMWNTGDVKMVDCDAAYLAANFVDGLGVNERAGWAWCDGRRGTKDRRGRIPIAYDDRTVDPLNGIWDILYNTLGYAGGAKGVILTITQMPWHDHIEQVSDAVNSGGREPVGFSGVVGGSFGPTARSTGKTGGNPANFNATDPHENRPPFIVTLFIQKITS